MKKLHYLVVGIGLAGMLNSCMFGDCVESEGDIITQTRDVTDFTGLDVSTMAEVQIEQGDKFECRIEASENQMELIETKVKGGILEISSDKCFKGDNKVKIFIKAPQFEEVSMSGIGVLKSVGTIKAEKFNLDLSGASEVKLTLEVDELDVDLSGASSIKLSGKAKSAEYDMSGAGDIDAEDFVVEDVTVHVSGVGHCIVNATKSLDGKISGAGDIEYVGNPTQVDVNTSGIGNIGKKDASDEDDKLDEEEEKKEMEEDAAAEKEDEEEKAQ